MEDFTKLYKQTKEQGPKLYAGWNEALFEEFWQYPAKLLLDKIGKQKQVCEIFSSYIKLIQEGIGLGYLHEVPECVRWEVSYNYDYQWQPDVNANIMEYCFAYQIPKKLVQIPVKKQLQILTKTWNLCEGVLQQPPWMGLYISKFLADLSDLGDLEKSLVKLLEPLLKNMSNSNWKGPFQVTVIDTSNCDQKFLPGPIYLVAPTVACVIDRRHPDVQISIFLSHQGKSEVIGITPPMKKLEQSEELGPVVFQNDTVAIEQHQITLPFLFDPYSHLRTVSGFLLASALDSQRIWIVESKR